ncbi:MAG: precorrin-2 C(20)-methyltransferase [Synergistaceae bacterium]|nr:precorrin-2 C(20)-methyltransferase [Synergistaceae bacterium]
MILTVAGVGPGDPDLVTRAAIKAAEQADLILEPVSRDGKASVAGEALKANLNNQKNFTPFLFPMIKDNIKRDAVILEQLNNLKDLWLNANNILLPVIGDSALYATGAYLYDVWRNNFNINIELELIPGISAHSLAASCAKKFLAMGDDILCVIPGTANIKRIEQALKYAEAAAVYKPSALKSSLKEMVMQTGIWREIVRVDRAGLPDQKIYYGEDALKSPDEYLSLLLLHR